MAKGYNAHREHLEEVASFGKQIGKRAGFKCEWCSDGVGLRLWEQEPEKAPTPGNLALLCDRCRELADGKRVDADQFRSIRNALWSDVPAVAEGAARVLARCREGWAREAIEDSLLSDEVKAELLWSR